MLRTLAKCFAIAVILIAIALAIQFNRILPFHGHPYFLPFTVLYGTATFVLILASLMALRFLHLVEKYRNQFSSTAILQSKIALNAVSPESDIFKKRAEFYDIKKIVIEITEEQQSIEEKKQAICTMMVSLQNQIMHEASPKVKQIEKLIDNIKQQSFILAQHVEIFCSEKNFERYIQEFNKINMNPKINKLTPDHALFPKNKRQLIIYGDQKVYQRLLKNLKEFSVSIQSFLSVLKLELNFLINKFEMFVKKGKIMAKPTKKLHNFSDPFIQSDQKTIPKRYKKVGSATITEKPPGLLPHRKRH